MNNDLISQVQKDVRLEQKQMDGIPQIAIGVFMVLIALFMMQGRESFLGLFIVLIPLVIEHLRKRFTYPRVGYARLREESSRRRGFQLLILAFLIAGVILFLLVSRTHLAPRQSHLIFSWLMAGIAVILVALMLFRFFRESNKIFAWYSAFIVLLVIAILLFHLPKSTMHLIVLAFGLANLVYGVVLLRAFIKKYPVLKDED